MKLVEVVIETDESEVAELCELYWAVNSSGQYQCTVKELTQRFGLRSGQVNELVRNYSRAYTADRRCPNCEKGFLVQTRSELATYQRLPVSNCKECRAELVAMRERQTAEVDAARRAVIISNFPIAESNSISVSDLDLRSAMTLFALVRDNPYYEVGIIAPLSARAQQLAPTHHLGVELTTSVFGRGLILIHPTSSPIDAFEWDGESLGSQFYPTKAAYYLSGSGQPVSRLSRLATDLEALHQYNSWPTSWCNELESFWKELAVAECEAYLIFCLDRHGLDFNPGAQTKATIDKALQWFTIGQIFNLIWRAARDAAAYLARERVSKQQAANSAVTRLRTSIERAYAEGWSLQPYGRDSRLQVSAISHLLFTSSLALSDPLSFNPISDSSLSAKKLQWGKLSAEEFERLIFSIVSAAEGYADVDWLMHTNAPDHGRDVGAMRLRTDSLSGFSQERVIIQCKHWTSRSIRPDEIAKEVVSVDHWTDPPVDVLVIATSGRFTADAVSWVERHNAKGVRPRVEMWNDAKLEMLLAERPHLILSFGLR
jgi:hypothetical protein